ncbi:hypothetical protein BHE97_19110 [Aeromicrobium sp. PE09-221]|uniref:copper transporter n=1 Tax=Aeromicrobium sp. PE09-221 TaxID=1898043 RepID=UPI000B652844|nr:copper transporter [Aeromicrobium sp. PE09-221]OUZ06411.1 hypothetical protein BHE97_19110 [Aeromicrobium sp. PE09-221]
MINLRYHLVSLAAVLFSLAAGIAIGAGLLDDAGASIASNQNRQQDISPAVAGFDAAYAENTGPDLIRDSLSDQSVVVFTTPGAQDAQVTGIVENLQTAGAQVTGQVALTSKLLAPANRQFSEGVANQSGGDAVTGESAYQRIGSALARAYLGTETAETDQDARTIRSAFVQGELLDQTTEPEQTATLAVIVTGPASPDDADYGAVVAQLAPALDDASSGVLVTGPVSSSEDRGIVGRVRAADGTQDISTFDVTDSATGRIMAVAALAREAEGNPGSWGTSRAADGPIP